MRQKIPTCQICKKETKELLEIESAKDGYELICIDCAPPSKKRFFQDNQNTKKVTKPLLIFESGGEKHESIKNA